MKKKDANRDQYHRDHSHEGFSGHETKIGMVNKLPLGWGQLILFFVEQTGTFSDFIFCPKHHPLSHFFELFAVLLVLYPIYVLFRPDREADRYFLFLGGTENKEFVIGYLEMLEIINNRSYARQIKRLEALFSKRKRNQRDSDRIEIIIQQSYFNQFNDRWIAFKRADWPLRILILLCLLAGILSFVSIIATIREDDPDPLTFSVFLLYFLIGIIPTFLFSLIIVGAYSLFFTILSIVFPNRGSVIRRSIILDEVIKGLKPGGRDTPVEFGENDLYEY